MRRKIELNASGKKMLAETFKVSVQNVSQALLFRRNSTQACQIREAALINGGKLVQIVDVTDETKRVVKVLNSKGELEKVLTGNNKKL